MTPVPRRRVIPAGAWVLAGVAAVLVFFGLNILFLQDPQTPPPAQVLVPVLAAGFLGGYVLLIGYIFGDAKRRGMRYIPWTILAALAPSAIGIILYFILRDPMPVHCTKCGCAMHPGFAFCPRCGATMSATCGQCHRVAETGWSHCAWCGGKL
jgi:peptidoglycan/LPS O-acetylase OafA/YrhL